MSDVDRGNGPEPDRSDPRQAAGIDYELDAEFVVDTAQRMKALGDPLRLLIVDLVLERAMSVTELAETVGRPRGSVAHHVDVLVKAGLLRVVRTRKVRAIDERFYGRVARTYVIAGLPQQDQLPFLDEVVAEVDTIHPTGPDRPAAVTYRRARIPAVRAAEFGERMLALALEFVTEPRSGDVEYGMYLAMFPTNRIPAPGVREGRPS